jgi:Fe-S cluster assembly protein SufD
MSPAQQSAALRSFQEQWRTRAPDALSGLRERALNRFLQLGLPTSHDESWRYTSLRPLASQSFVDAPGPDSPRAAAPTGLDFPGADAPRADAATEAAIPGSDASGAAVRRAAVVGLDRRRRALELPAARALLGGRADAEAHAIVLVNGHPLLPPAADAGVQIRALSALARDNPDLLVRDLEPLSDAEELRWLLLNTALGVDGVHIKITGALATPLLVLHVGSADRPGTVAYPRVIIEAAAGSAGTVIEHHIQHGAAAPLSNSATLLNLERDARIEHYRVFAAGEQAVHFDTLQVRLQRNAECRQFTVALGGGLVRTSLDARLSEPGAKLDSRALLVGHADRHVDCVNVVRHAAARTVSRQTARAIASGTSRVIFNSKVVVDAGASQSDSQQSCRGLLLSPTAEIDSRPQLEIHTDEVKCAHGATTGRLDPNMLFYMLSRGLDRETAQSLLVYAFLADVLTDMSEVAARAAIENELIRQLPDSQRLQGFR